MRYIITESKLEQTIINYLDELFEIDNINSFNPYEYNDETDEEYDDYTRVQFYIGDYEDGDNDIFKWYDCDYFDEDSDPKNRCPLVVIDHPYDKTLLAYFGDKWEEPFKKWFTENFDLPVKTVEWSRIEY
jgi:hypothetical protein